MLSRESTGLPASTHRLQIRRAHAGSSKLMKLVAAVASFRVIQTAVDMCVCTDTVSVNKRDGDRSTN